MKKLFFLAFCSVMLFSCEVESSENSKNETSVKNNSSVNSRILTREEVITQGFYEVLKTSESLTFQEIEARIKMFALKKGLTETAPKETTSSERGIDCVLHYYNLPSGAYNLFVCTVSVFGVPLYTNYTLDVSSNGTIKTYTYYDFFD